jgi:hypothetical protein
MEQFINSIENLKNSLYDLVHLDNIEISNINQVNFNIEKLISDYNELLKPIVNYLNLYYKGIFVYKNNIDELYFENINLFYTIINNILTIINNIYEILNLSYSKVGYNYKHNLLKIQKQKLMEVINELDLIISGISILLLNFNELLNINEQVYKTNQE